MDDLLGCKCVLENHFFDSIGFQLILGGIHNSITETGHHHVPCQCGLILLKHAKTEKSLNSLPSFHSHPYFYIRQYNFPEERYFSGLTQIPCLIYLRRVACNCSVYYDWILYQRDYV